MGKLAERVTLSNTVNFTETQLSEDDSMISGLNSFHFKEDQRQERWKMATWVGSHHASKSYHTKLGKVLMLYY